MTSKRAEIIEKLKEMGAEPKRSLGQNFLVSSHVIDKIVAAVCVSDPVSIIEVGPGLGALTEGLGQLGKPLLLLELDRRFADHWRSRGFKVVEGDALVLDWGTLGLESGTTLVSNLPYQISSSLVIERSIDPCGIATMVLMFQKEVAQRLMARPRTKDYGLLTVIAQTFWDIRLLLEAGPSDFYPPPNVASRVLVFTRSRPEGLSEPGDFLRFCKAAFAQRRKLMVRNLLAGWLGGDKARLPRLEAALADLGLGSQVRAEELDPSQFLRLYERLRG